MLGEKWAGRVEEGLGIGEPLDLDGRLGHPASLRGDRLRVGVDRRVCRLIKPKRKGVGYATRLHIPFWGVTELGP